MGLNPGKKFKFKGKEMLSRGLFFVAVVAAVVSLVFLSIPAALTAGVIGVFAFASKGLN